MGNETGARYSADPQGMWCPKCHTYNPPEYRRCAKCRAPMVRRTSPLLVGGFALGFLVILLGLGRLFSGRDAVPALETITLPSPTAPPERPEANVAIRRFSWRKEDSGATMIANFTVRNDNTYPVDDIRVECQVSEKHGPSVAYLEGTIPGPIAPDTARNYPDFAMGRIENWVTRAGCRVKSAEKGL